MYNAADVKRLKGHHLLAGKHMASAAALVVLDSSWYHEPSDAFLCSIRKVPSWSSLLAWSLADCWWATLVFFFFHTCSFNIVITCHFHNASNWKMAPGFERYIRAGDNGLYSDIG